MANAIKNYLKELSILGGFTTLGMTYSVWQAPNHWPHEFQILAGDQITYSDALSLQPIWIDARSIEAFESDALPDALNLNPSNWEAQLPQLVQLWLENSSPIVVYCQSTQCQSSQQIAALLREQLPEAEIYSLLSGEPLIK
jgi:rhodanese-related sulfurtransferase